MMCWFIQPLTPPGLSPAEPLQVFQPSPLSSLTSAANWIIDWDENWGWSLKDLREVYGSSAVWTGPDMVFSVNCCCAQLFWQRMQCVSNYVSFLRFVLMTSQAGLICSRLMSFMLSWRRRHIYFCLSLLWLSCLRLARKSEPPQAPQPIHSLPLQAAPFCPVLCRHALFTFTLLRAFLSSHLGQLLGG